MLIADQVATAPCTDPIQVPATYSMVRLLTLAKERIFIDAVSSGFSFLSGNVALLADFGGLVLSS